MVERFIPFHNRTEITDRIIKALVFSLIAGMIQFISISFQIYQAPKAQAATTYGPTTATSITIPSGVSSITFTMFGGGGGNGGLDCGRGCTLKTAGARGKVTGTFTVVAGDVVGIFPGYAGTSGTSSSTNGGGGAGGLDTIAGANYNGGAGGNAGSSGSSGGGGGGGAASVLTKNSSIWAVAGGAAGAGGAANLANSGQNGNNNNSSSTGGTNGGAGVQTLNDTNNGSDKPCTNQTNDGGGGGGGGGGVNGGSGGNLTNAGSGECSGLAGYRGGNSLNAAITSTTNGTDSSANTSNGAIEITMNLSVPTSITTSASLQSFTVSWASAAAAQSFSLKIFNAAGNSLLQTVSVASGTYTKTISSSDFASIATGTTYQISVTAIGNSEAPYKNSAESGKVSVTTSTPFSITSDTSTITRKYGTSGATRSILSTGGTDTTTITASSNSLAGGKITFTGATGLLSIDTRTAVGTYLDTITVTDATGATATYVQTIIMTAADTLTVTTDTPTAVTYTGAIASISPTVSAVSGLVSGDVINTATINYSASTATCANGGLCSVGEIGPGGGYVFYVSPTAINVAAGISTGGIYLEAAPVGAQGTAQYGCTGSSSPGTSYSVGSGASNTLAIISSCATAGIAARVTSDLTYAGFSDWFMPSLDEMTLIYNNLYNRTPSLGGFTGLDYGSSSEGTNGFGYQAYWWFGAGAVSGQTDKNYVGYYRPIRAFNPIYTSAISYGPSTTKPTNAGTYTITPSVLTFTDGAAANYTAITYRTSTVTINKASQSTLSLTSRVGVFSANPSTMKLTTSGGNDTGTVTYAISSGGSALNCTISGDQLTVTSTGTCLVAATKAATNNYLVITSDTVTVTFNLFVDHQPIQTQQVPTQIPINGANSLETTTATVPMITSISLLSGVYQVNGTGFSGVSRVTIGGEDVTYTYVSPTQINIPTGAGVTEGSRIVIECTDGRRGPSPREIFRVFSS